MSTAAESDPVLLHKIKDLCVVLHRKTPNCSDAWLYWGKLKYKDSVLSNGRLYCNICIEQARKDNKFQSLAVAGVKSFTELCATTNMINHLKNDHKLNLKKNSVTTNSIKTYYSNNGPNLVAPSQKSHLFHRNIVLWFARDLEAFNKIGLDGIADFFIKYGIIKAKDDLPDPTTLARQALTDVYEATKTVIVHMLSESPSHGSLTVDMWTDSYCRHKYIGFTYHYINENWDLTNITLRVASLPNAHTADNIKKEIKETLRIFGLLQKNITILRDNGANIKAACEQGKYTSYGCVGHGLHNLVVKDGFEKVAAVQAVLVKCRTIVRSLSFKSEELLRLGGEEFSKNLEQVAELESALILDSNIEVESSEEEVQQVQAPTTLKRDLPTRWNSSLNMLQSLLRNRQAVSRMLIMIGRADDDLDDDEYVLIGQLINFLKLFKTATEYLSGSTYPTANLALLLRSEIRSALAPSSSDSESIKSLKFFMKKNFDKRFPVTHLFLTAALLDPRLQNLTELDTILQKNGLDKAGYLKSQAEKFVTDDVNAQPSDPDIEHVPTTSKKPKINELIKKHSSTARATVTLDHEISTLLSSKDVDNDVLEYWKKNRSNFPTLSKLSMSIFGVPATSVPCERLFSIAGLVVTAKRSSLSPYSVDRLVFVHDNYEHGKNYVNNSNTSK